MGIAINKEDNADHLLGVRIGSGSLDDLKATSMKALDGFGPPVTFACANPHSLVEAQRHEDVLAALQRTSLVVADGVGVSLIANLLKIDVGPRITGAEYFFAIMRGLEERGGGRVFFFGSSEQVLELIAGRFSSDFPSITLCGVLSPPYRSWSPEENDEMIARINETMPDVCWVGMTAPKQELWVDANLSALNARIIGSIGAVFDFYAGTYPRAPDWMCHAGLEWLYRLIREPRRMWRRTFISAPRFLHSILTYHLLS